MKHELRLDRITPGAAVAGALLLWLGTRGLKPFPLRLGGSIAAAALLTRTGPGRRGLNHALRWIPLRRPLD